jgi:PilZ domain
MKTTPEISDSSATIKPERRLTPRKKLDQVVYIDLRPGNGGIVSNISQGGLGFHAVGPVEQAGPIPFWFSLGVGDRIEAIGELAWTDETKKVGGLRFTDLPESTREQIRNHLGQSSKPINSGSAFRDPVAAPNKSPAFPSVEPDEEEVPVPASYVARPHEAASSKKSAPTIIPSLFGLASPEPEPMWKPISAAWPDPPRRPQFLRGVITGALVSALLATAFLYHTHRREVGGSLIHLGESIASQTASPAPAAAPASNPSPADAASADKMKTEGASTQETKSQMASSAPAATTTSNPSPADAASADKMKAETASIESAGNAVASTPARHGPRASQPANSGESELTVAQQYLHGRYGRRDTTTGAQWLWAAVKNGSATAEVLLADLYRRGDGVPKSCEQARVLLVAASRRGQAEATQKLRQLNRYGCP